MTEITFNITGIGNLIEDLRMTKCHCDNEACNSNSAWAGRKTLSLPPKCLLSHVCMDEEGRCGDNSVEELCRDQDHHVITGTAAKASVKAQDLLKRVSNDAGDFSKAEGSYQIPGKLFKEIFDYVSALEE